MEFRPIPGFEAYEISRDGVLRRRLPHQGRGRAALHEPIALVRGRAHIKEFSGSKRVWRSVTTLVTLAFGNDPAFRPIPSFPNYEINRQGIVRRRRAKGGTRIGRELKPRNGRVTLAIISPHTGRYGSVVPNINRLIVATFGVPEMEFAEAPDLPGEEWRSLVSYKAKPAVDYAGHYEVSKMGRVRRCSFAMGTSAGRILTGTLRARLNAKREPTGKFDRWISLPRPGSKHALSFKLSRLVATAFYGFPERGMQANHKNGDTLDDRAENLEWSTGKANIAHRDANQLIKRRNPNTRLTSESVRDIRALHGTVPVGEIAKCYDVSRGAIEGVLSGRNWKHVK